MSELPTVKVTLEDSCFAGVYELDLGKCTGKDDIDVRRETGSSLFKLLEDVQTDSGMLLTFVCIVVWLVRRRNDAATFGPNMDPLQFSRVLEEVPWGSKMDLDVIVSEEPDEETVGKEPVSANDSLAS